MIPERISRAQATIVLSVLWLKLLAVGVSAQEVPEVSVQPPTIRYVEGFGSLDWGASLSKIQAERGEPELTREAPANAISVAYSDRVLNHDVIIALLIHMRDGLMKGGYTFQMDIGENCLVWYRRVVEAIDQRYPMMEKVESRRGNNSSLDFCDGATIGEAAALTTWRDPAGTTISVTIKPGDDDVLVYYETRRFREWAELAGEIDRREAF